MAVEIDSVGGVRLACDDNIELAGSAHLRCRLAVVDFVGHEVLEA